MQEEPDITTAVSVIPIIAIFENEIVFSVRPPLFTSGGLMSGKIKKRTRIIFMALDISKTLGIIETMENYISKVRPKPEIRHLLDIGYEIRDQSVILQEIRPAFRDPTVIRRFGYAKATFVHSKNSWKIYWKRADLEWHSYSPRPSVRQLKDFLKLVDEDRYACFKG